MPTPAYEKNNAFTRLINEVANANRGTHLGSRGHGRMQQVVSGEAPPAVSTPSMREVPPLISQLPPDEQARLDAKLSEVTGEPMVEDIPYSIPPPRVPARHQGLPDFSKVEGIDIINGQVIIDGAHFPIPEEDLDEIKLYCVDVVTKAITREVAKALVLFSKPGATSGQTTEGTAEKPGAETHPEPVPPPQPKVRRRKRVVKETKPSAE